MLQIPMVLFLSQIGNRLIGDLLPRAFLKRSSSYCLGRLVAYLFLGRIFAPTLNEFLQDLSKVRVAGNVSAISF